MENYKLKYTKKTIKEILTKKKLEPLLVNNIISYLTDYCYICSEKCLDNDLTEICCENFRYFCMAHFKMCNTCMNHFRVYKCKVCYDKKHPLYLFKYQDMYECLYCKDEYKIDLIE